MHRILPNRRVAVLAVAAVLSLGLPVVAAAAVPPVAGSYVATAPTRVLDTRTGAYGNPQGAVAAQDNVSVVVTGASGVPADASAVAVTVTVVSATSGGSITASTDGLTSRPKVTAVQFAAGGRATDLAVVAPSAAGRIELWNASSGAVQLVADVLGYYAGGTPAGDGTLHAVPPTRAVTYAGGLVQPGTALSPKLGAAAGLPGSAGAVAATVTVLDPARSGSLIAYATGTTRPSTPLLDFAAGHSVSQYAVLPISDTQQLSLFNASSGTLHVLVDVVGWFAAGPAATAGTQQVVAANRIFSDGVLPAHGSDAVPVLGRGGVPKRGVSAVVISARVSAPGRTGTLTGGADAAPIVTSFVGGQKMADGQAVLPVDNGTVTLRNTSGGAVGLEVDVVGYVVSSTINVPAARSVARYANDLTLDVSHDTSVMNQHGRQDAAAGATFVLLDLGAQTTKAPLSAGRPGIALTLTQNPVVRLSYTDLVTVLKGYIRGVTTGGRHVLLAVGTNNDGDWRAYGAAARGRQFANLLIDPVKSYGAARNVAVVGANDIEANFASTEAQAQDWENAYFANTSADLVFNGALNDCPTVFGDLSPCAFGWTQKQYWQLAHHVENGRNRTQVLPQIYFPVQAVQWANVFAHGGGGLRFAGSLTEFAADSSTFTSEQGWAALYRALQWQLTSALVPRAVDIGAAP